MPHFLIDNEIELRPFIESDAEEIYQTVKANLGHLHTFLHWATEDYNLQSAREFIRQAQIAAAENKSQAFGIYLNGKLTGSVGFVSFSWMNKRAEIGYWIAKDFEGRGIITKSCKELINYAFDELEMNRIEIRCATANARSRALPEKLGFKQEGVLRQSEWRHNQFYDRVIYAVLKEEWKFKQLEDRSQYPA